MTKKPVIIIFLVLFAALIYIRIDKIRHRQVAESIEGIQLKTGLPVRVYVAEPKTLIKTVSVSGGMEAYQKIQIAPKISDRIAAIHVQTGQKVEAGELLVTLDDTAAKISLAQAQANLAQAQHQLEKLRNGSRPQEIASARAATEEAQALTELRRLEFERQQNLFKQDATTLQRVQDTENGFRMAQAALASANAQYDLMQQGPRKEDIQIAQSGLELAQAAVAQNMRNIEYHYLRSPCGGLVTLRQLEPGDIAEINQMIFYILSMDRVYLIIDVSEIYAPGISVGMKVDVIADAFENRRFIGTIAEINPAANTAERAFRTRIVIENPDMELKPGMFGRAEIITSRKENAMMIPADAIKKDGDKFYVLVVDADNTARRVDIAVGDEAEDRIEVLSGLEGGMKVIGLSRETVQPGSKVTVSETYYTE